MPMSFHDSSLIGLSCKEQSIFLALEDIYVEDARFAVDVVIHGVEAMTRGGNPFHDLAMETADGEVLRLERQEEHRLFIVRWHKHNPNSHHMAAYLVFGKNIDMRIEEAQPRSYAATDSDANGVGQ